MDVLEELVARERIKDVKAHSPEIGFDGPDAADVIRAMQDRAVWDPGTSPIPSMSAVSGYGHYRERYVRRDGRRRIAWLTLTRIIVEPQP